MFTCAAGNGSKWVENGMRLLFAHDFHWSSKMREPLIKETATREDVSLDGKRECFIGSKERMFHWMERENASLDGKRECFIGWSQSGKPLCVSGKWCC